MSVQISGSGDFGEGQAMWNLKCGRCGCEIEFGEEEICWWCRGSLCVDCWEKFGHCGHREADEVNRKAREFYAEHDKI